MSGGNSRDIWPSIWLGSFESKHAFDMSPQLQGVHTVLDKLDDKILASRHPFSIQAYCAACGAVTIMHITWHYGVANPQGSINPAWTETAICEHCRLNSRMRAVVDYLKSLTASGARFENVYLAEKATPSYKAIKNIFGQVVSSEYLGPDKTSGSKSFFVNKQLMIRHEDLTALSFSNESFDLVITQDVFEHIPNYRHSFSECARIIRDNGVLVFSIPFFFNLEKTQIRASLLPNGNIEHHLPAEIHGNPVSKGGSLCFQNFGWDILSDLRACGFKDSKASLYWGPWQGHLGFPFFVFSATK